MGKGEVIVMVDAWVDEDLDKLIEGRHPYSKDDQGTVDSDHLVLIGESGSTGSLGKWILEVMKASAVWRQQKGHQRGWDEGDKLIGREYIKEVKGGKELYFSLEVQGREYVVGGCREYGGEGGQGSILVKRFFERLGVAADQLPSDVLLQKAQTVKDSGLESELLDAWLSDLSRNRNQ